MPIDIDSDTLMTIYRTLTKCLQAQYMIISFDALRTLQCRWDSLPFFNKWKL